MNIRTVSQYLRVMLGAPNEKVGFDLVTRLGRRLLPNYRFTWPELAWFQNRELRDVLSRFDESEGFNAHRRFALQQLLRLTSNIPGDTAECGVYRGCGSYIILRANQRSSLDRVHHIFDSFAGLSSPSSRDGEYWAVNDLSVEERVVRDNLSAFDGVKLYKGWIPDRFADVADRTFSFVHVDVDLHQPTLQSLEFFYDRLNMGAIFVSDDYGFLTCPGATAAIDNFLLLKPEKMISLPGGGGFFLKGCVTSPE